MHMLLLVATALSLSFNEKQNEARFNKISETRLTIWNDHLSEVIRGIFSSLVASRIYNYPNSSI